MIEINADPEAQCESVRIKKESPMPTNDIAFLVLVVGALALFGGVLGWASWDEFRRTRRTSR